MSFAKIFLLSPVLLWVAEAGAVPASASTVTVYEAVASQFASLSGTPVSSGTGELDVSILGVSTGSEGTETTYSIGEYISIPTVTSVATLTKTGQTETTTFLRPGLVFTENNTLVESSGGYWFSLGLSTFASGTYTRNGFYETCTFDANGGSSASCIEIDYFPTSSGTFQVTESFEASKTPLVILPTSSSNAAISTWQGPYWEMGLYASMLCVFVLVV
ncbi:hypothetical protein BT96DRAFT_692134 [Gymnopus androsaceus JB14]|uniref:Uncharacterized protein n=1 Tax=Gymnopus androsaceus JB14 TaxID=1447944 RepID=A0A6A4HP45_9AGAR|nr:hypothetical protein BT96DRAFT_692134 [Gymnopus androsaceus JB14]